MQHMQSCNESTIITIAGARGDTERLRPQTSECAALQWNLANCLPRHRSPPCILGATLAHIPFRIRRKPFHCISFQSENRKGYGIHYGGSLAGAAEFQLPCGLCAGHVHNVHKIGTDMRHATTCWMRVGAVDMP